MINDILSKVNGKLDRVEKAFDDTSIELTWSSSSNEPCAKVELDRLSGSGRINMYADDGSDYNALHIDGNGLTYNDELDNSTNPIFNVSPAGVLKTNSLTDGTTTKTMTEVVNPSFEELIYVAQPEMQTNIALANPITNYKKLYICCEDKPDEMLTMAMPVMFVTDTHYNKKYVLSSDSKYLTFRFIDNQTIYLDTTNITAWIRLWIVGTK